LAGEREASAFGPFIKILAWLMCLGIAAWIFRLGLSLQQAPWAWAALALMVYTAWHIQRSRTRLSTQALEQSWIWNKRFEYSDLAYAKLIRIRGLEWLIAPRVYVRTMMGKFAVFYSSDPAMLDEFARLGESLKAFYQQPENRP
jgi:hypothetical protein